MNITVTVNNLDYRVTYKVLGAYQRGTWYDPPEYPDLDIIEVVPLFSVQDLEPEDLKNFEADEEKVLEAVYNAVFANEPWINL